MKVIQGILKEEKVRLQEALGSYQREIEKLPKGSLQSKQIKERCYVYRAYRKGNKVVYDYLGRLEPEERKDLERKIKLRRLYEEKLREVKHDLREMRRMIRE